MIRDSTSSIAGAPGIEVAVAAAGFSTLTAGKVSVDPTPFGTLRKVSKRVVA